MTTRNRGILAAISAFVFWGLTPIYWSYLSDVPAVESITHRIWWAFPLLWTIILLRRPRTGRVIPSRRVFLIATVAGVLVTANWLTYVWAVTNGHTLDASLGYYINPLVSVALGTVVLKERLDRLQTAAVVLAAIGVIYLTVRLGSVPWISLVLAGSFGVYGLIKKQIPVGSIHSLALELVALAPLALGVICYQIVAGTSSLTHGSFATTVLLVAAGAVTVIPLMLFGYAAKTIRLSDVGFVQYIAPTLMLLLGTLVSGEVLDLARLPGFILVWIALALYSAGAFGGVRSRRGDRTMMAAPHSKRSGRRSQDSSEKMTE